MTCPELEQKLCDYIDGTLRSDENARIDAHLSLCPECAALCSDSRGLLAFLERVPEPEPPPMMVTQILQQIPARAGAGGIGVPAGVRTKGFFGRLFEPVLQPRLVMGMAMTILSFAMLGRFAGIEARQLRASDLSPVAIWESAEDRVHRTWVRAVKYYQSLKIVYEVQARLQELTETEEPQPLEETESVQPGQPPPGPGPAK